MLSETLRAGIRVRANDDAQYGPGMVGTVTQVYGGRSYRAAEVKFDSGRTALFWHYQIDPIEQQDH
jgi:hypothetical protein